MNDGPATDMTNGTVVALGDVAWIKTGERPDHPWNDTNGNHAGNNYIDLMLTGHGAALLRHGKES